MQGVNKVILVGNLGNDPNVITLEDGTCVSKFSIATSEIFKGKDGEKVSNTEWHNVVVWGNLAEFVKKYLKKGSHLYLEGKLKTRTFDDKDNRKVRITEIIADQILLLDKKSD